jgi:8-oxo-dGTP pyrophosphatase MutT (NUDIX family)
MTLHADAVDLLERWMAPNPEQGRLRTTYLRHLAEHEDGVFRECHPDHLTASTLVVSSDGERVLFNLHRKYGIWVQFGGHCERADPTFAHAALREAREESGIEELNLVGTGPMQLSTHEVRCGPLRPSHHLDVRYVAVAPPDALPNASAESLEVRWFSREALPPHLDCPLRELVEWSR